MRFNIFNQIHKGLRALLYDTALLLQRTNFQDEYELQQAIERVQLVADLFDDHAHHEDEFVLPAIRQYEPSLVDAFEQEHVTDMKLAHNMRSSLEGLQLASFNVKPEMGKEVIKCFSSFMLFNLEHMEKEESVLNKVLWRYYSDQEIIGIQQNIVKSLTPWGALHSSTWMMRGLNNAEIRDWLKAVEQTAPPDAFQQLYTLAEKELPLNRFQNVLESLTDGAMLAN